MANYCLGPVSKAYRAIERHARQRLRQWLCRKQQVRWPAIHRFPGRYIDEQLGLLRLSQRTTSFHGRSREASSVSRARKIRMSRFDERDVEAEHGAANERSAYERLKTDRRLLNHRATSRLSK
jgi:hypothetical protein